MTNELTISEPKNLETMIAQEEDKRKLLTKYVKKNLTKGTDFYELTIGGRISKPSLSKSGSEKVMSLFHWIAEFTKDDDTWEMLGKPAGVLCYKCVLFSSKGVKVGEGKGARDTKKDNGDFNKSIKMAQKSAQIDAVLRTGGLSDVFTQDLEDMKEKEISKFDLPAIEYGNAPVNAQNRVGRTKTEKFMSDTTQPNEAVKKTIFQLLKRLQVPKEEMLEWVEKKTDLKLIPENYETIVERLDIILKERQ